MRARLLVWLSSLLVAVLVLSSAVDYQQSLRFVLQAYDLSLSDAALGIVGFISVDNGQATFDIPEQSIKLLQSDSQDTVMFRAVDPHGHTLAGDEQVPLPPAASRDSSGELQHQFYDADVRGQPVRVFAHPVGTSIGVCTIMVAETVHKRTDARRRILLGRLSNDALILMLTLGVVWLVVGFATRPLGRLADQLRRRSGEDLRPLPDDGLPGEAIPLVHSLNRLFGQIADTRDGQRRFIENAAHQLRTPLTGLKGQIELTANEASRMLPVDSPLLDRLRSAQVATNRLTHLANQLLSLARSERPSFETVGRQQVSLPMLVDEVVSGCLDAALARGQDLGAETAPAEMRAVSWEIREMLTNLIDNAIRYTPEGGRITVRCGRLTGQPFIEVEDNGPGIPAAERQRVLERFYRMSGSPQGGSGLGLAIVNEIAKLHDAVVEIGDPLQGPGTRIRVQFGVSASA